LQPLDLVGWQSSGGVFVALLGNPIAEAVVIDRVLVRYTSVPMREPPRV
jgi:hypothetical protein